MDAHDDILFEIFENLLHRQAPQDDTDEDFVLQVVSEYLFYLFQKGFIPQKCLDSLEEDLKEEVFFMLKKVTYGYYNIKAYRQAHNHLWVKTAKLKC